MMMVGVGESLTKATQSALISNSLKCKLRPMSLS